MAYIIVRAGTIATMQTRVAEKIAEGYFPIGGAKRDHPHGGIECEKNGEACYECIFQTMILKSELVDLISDAIIQSQN